MYKARYDTIPEPVSVERQLNFKTGETYLLVRVTANAQRELDSESMREVWVVDENAFSEKEGVLELDAVLANPAAFLQYFSVEFRGGKKKEAQDALDALRDSCPIVPVPNYREGATVCNRPRDQIFLLEGARRGGLPAYELANGEMVSLTAADIDAIAADVAAAEMSWQLGKQACWRAIDEAHSEAEMDSAIASYKATLDGYRMS